MSLYGRSTCCVSSSAAIDRSACFLAAACPATNQYGLEYRDYKEGGKVVRPCVIENYSMNHKNQVSR